MGCRKGRGGTGVLRFLTPKLPAVELAQHSSLPAWLRHFVNGHLEIGFGLKSIIS